MIYKGVRRIQTFGSAKGMCEAENISGKGGKAFSEEGGEFTKEISRGKGGEMVPGPGKLVCGQKAAAMGKE